MDFVLGKWSTKACIRGHTLPACERFVECDRLMNRRQGFRRDGPLTTAARNRDSSPYGTTPLVAFMSRRMNRGQRDTAGRAQTYRIQNWPGKLMGSLERFDGQF